MNRFWSFLFLLVPVLGIGLVLGAANQLGFLGGMWLPESIGPRTESIDYLFVMIHIILGIVFAGTGFFLALSLWRFDAARQSAASNRRASLMLELCWTLIPAGVLIFLSLHQLPYWNQNKVFHPLQLMGVGETRAQPQVPIARVSARQYGWRFEYPGDDGEFDTHDDVLSENELVLPVNRQIVLELNSEDVIHSFSITELRLKQDIVPGLNPHIWFSISKTGQWEISCAELCGWGHYRMKARLRTVPPAQFTDWLKQSYAQQIQ